MFISVLCSLTQAGAYGPVPSRHQGSVSSLASQVSWTLVRPPCWHVGRITELPAGKRAFQAVRPAVGQRLDVNTAIAVRTLAYTTLLHWCECMYRSRDTTHDDNWRRRVYNIKLAQVLIHCASAECKVVHTQKSALYQIALLIHRIHSKMLLFSEAPHSF